MKLPYDLKNPAKIYKLADKYMEISGVWPNKKQNSLFFVQDEAIQVNSLNLRSSKITEYAALKPGDSEDIVILNNTAYILHAGEQPAIYIIKNYNSRSAQCKHYELHLEWHYDPEGLCYDVRKKRLLIACKGSPVKNDRRRKIFSFDLKSRKRSTSALFTVDSRDFLSSKKDIFNPSGIAVHPHSNDIFIVGPRGVKMLVCYSADGAFKGAWKLDKKRFIQPEGIAFMPSSGELILATEGRPAKKRKKRKKAKIFVFPVNK